MIQKKKNTWHKNTSKPNKKMTRTEKQRQEEKHWVVSQAKLMKILEASGMQPQKPMPMLPRTRDR